MEARGISIRFDLQKGPGDACADDLGWFFCGTELI